MFKVGDKVRIRKDVLEQYDDGYWNAYNRLTLFKEHWDQIFTIMDTKALIDGFYRLNIKLNLPPETSSELIFIPDELQLVNEKSCDCPMNLILIRGCQNKDHF